MGTEEKTSLETGSGYLADILSDGAKTYTYRSGVRALLGLVESGGISLQFPSVFHPGGYVHLSNAARHRYSINTGGRTPFFGKYQDTSRMEPEDIDQRNFLTLDRQDQSISPADALDSEHQVELVIPGITAEKTTFHRMAVTSQSPPQVQPISPGTDQNHHAREGEQIREKASGKDFLTTALAQGHPGLPGNQNQTVDISIKRKSPGSHPENRKGRPDFIYSDKKGANVIAANNLLVSPLPDFHLPSEARTESEGTSRKPGITMASNTLANQGTSSVFLEQFHPPDKSPEFEASQRKWFSQSNADEPEIFGGAVNSVRPEIERLRLASRKHWLTETTMTAMSSKPEREKTDESPGIDQNQEPEVQRLVVFRRISNRAAPPSAFWERSYLGRFYLRPLR